MPRVITGMTATGPAYGSILLRSPELITRAHGFNTDLGCARLADFAAQAPAALAHTHPQTLAKEQRSGCHLRAAQAMDPLAARTRPRTPAAAQSANSLSPMNPPDELTPGGIAKIALEVCRV